MTPDDLVNWAVAAAVSALVVGLSAVAVAGLGLLLWRVFKGAP